MSNTISEMLTDLARLAALSNENFLAYLCRMAALEAHGKHLFKAAKHRVIGLWDWDVARDRVRLNPGASVLLGNDPARMSREIQGASRRSLRL